MYRGERSEKFGRENEAVGEGRRKEKAIKERGQGRERARKRREGGTEMERSRSWHAESITHMQFV